MNGKEKSRKNNAEDIEKEEKERMARSSISPEKDKAEEK